MAEAGAEVVTGMAPIRVRWELEMMVEEMAVAIQALRLRSVVTTHQLRGRPTGVAVVVAQELQAVVVFLLQPERVEQVVLELLSLNMLMRQASRSQLQR